MTSPSAYLTILCLYFAIVLYFLVNLERILKKRSERTTPNWFLWTYSGKDRTSRSYRYFCYVALIAMLVLGAWLIAKAAIDLGNAR